MTKLKTLAICVTNKIPVNEGYEEEFEDRFSKRVHLVDQSPGFIRNEVHRPTPMKFDHKTLKWVDDPQATAYYEVKTWWRSMKDFENWTRSKAFAEAHSKRPPKDMFAGQSRLEFHHVFLSTDLKQVEDESPPGYTLEELSKYRGENGAPIYIGLEGKVYDVSESAGFYGPGGGYHVFAGRDATRALAKGLLEDHEVLDRPGDVSDLNGMEQMKLDDWVDRFEGKYPCIGFIVTSSNTKKKITIKKKVAKL